MPATYEPITTQTVSVAVASITFSAISQAYTDLVLVCSVVRTANANLCLQFNSDTATNYSASFIDANGTTMTSSRLATQSNMFVDYALLGTTNFNTNINRINNYSNTTTWKTCLTTTGQTGQQLSLMCNMWRSTAAVTAIKVFPSSGNLDVGSTLTLYGIKAA